MLLTDIHAHVLSGVDDGPENIDESATLLQTMQQAGISQLFCTSHYCHPRFQNSLADLEKSFHALSTGNKGIFPSLKFGAEIRLSSALQDSLRHDAIPCLGTTSYVLVEFDNRTVSRVALDLIYELRIRGYLPIVAHPERNLEIQRRPDWLDEFRENGLLIQATAGCFVQKDGRRCRANKLAWKFLKEGKIDLIASDTHNLTTRLPRLLPAYERIADELNEQVVETLLNNANAIWAGDACVPISPYKRVRRHYLARFVP